MKTPTEQKIIFVTGKGGVGKSAVAAGMALAKAKAGKKTLLVELGDQSFYKDYFDLKTQVSYQPQKLRENLDVALWSGPECLKEYARFLLKLESVYKLFFENAVTRSLIQVAPALSELAVMGKVTSHPRKIGPPLNYDCIVVDAFATGHFLALLKAPLGMAEAVRFGPMGEQSRSVNEVLKNKSICSYYVVSLPEELPVQEAIELSQGIKKVLGVSPIHLFNRLVSPSAEALMTPVTENYLQDFQKYLRKMSEQEKSLSKKLKADGEVKNIPQIYSIEAWPVVEDIATRLGEVLG